MMKQPYYLQTRFIFPYLLIFLFSATALRSQHDGSVNICGIPTPLVQPKAPIGYRGFVDRFNIPVQPSKALIAWQQSHQLQGTTECGGFRIDFEDVILGTQQGFDDPTPITHPVLGSTTLGALRQRTICEVFRYVGEKINIKGSPDIIIRQSLNENSGILGAASPVYRGGFPLYSGAVHSHSTTGVDPTPEPGDYDAYIFFNFYYGYHSDWASSSGTKVDLYSVALHEATHCLGFLSLISSDGSSRLLGAYSHYDALILDGSGQNLIDATNGLFIGDPLSITSNLLDSKTERCNSINPVYSPPIYEPGSSLSHFDRIRSGIPYVMHPSTPGGDNREYTEEELQVLCELGYDLKNGVCSSCAPRGINDFASTTGGVEICIDLLSNDVYGGIEPLSIDTASVDMITGEGTWKIVNNQLCYTPSTDYFGVTRFTYRPSNGKRSGNKTIVEIGVTSNPGWPRSGRKDAFIWYFGNRAGITFKNGLPQPLLDGAMTQHEGTAVYCHPVTGELMFYTNGVTVWNRKHQIMPNGNDLMGHRTSTQTVLIVPFPNDTNQFYIFTVGAGLYVSPNNNGFRCSVVDMRLDNGNGVIKEKNIELLDSTAEKLSATRHCNGKDYWVLVHRFGNDSTSFYAFPVTDKGVGQPTVTALGIPYKTGNDLQGSLKFSPDAKQLAVTSSGPKRLELYDFDNSTGSLYNVRTIATDDYYYGVEFSPDGKKLYTVPLPFRTDPTSLIQWDLSAGSVSGIQTSRVVLHTETDSWDGAQLQLGPDNRVYVGFFGRTYLGAIINPNLQGTAASYVHNGVSLAGRSTEYGLPNFIGTDLYSVAPQYMKMDVGLTHSPVNPRLFDTVTYTARLCNLGTVPLIKTAFRIDLPPGVQYLDGLTAFPVVTVSSIGPRSCDSLVFRAIVTPAIQINQRLTACISPDSSEVDGECFATANSCTSFKPTPTDILVRKSVDVSEAKPGAVLHYAIFFANQGPAIAHDVIVKDVLPAPLKYRSHQISPNATFDPATGLISAPVLAVGERVDLSVECQIDESFEGLIENCATLTGMVESDINFSNNSECAQTIVDRCDERYLMLAHIGQHHSYASGDLMSVPVFLDSLEDPLPIYAITISVDYDPNNITFDRTVPHDSILIGTLLQNWSITDLTVDEGKVRISLTGAPGINRTTPHGPLLKLPFRMYLGLKTGRDTDLQLGIELPEHECVTRKLTDGYATLDSICGLNWRIIEVFSGEKYDLKTVIPNPVRNNASIEFSLGLDGPTRLNIYNLSGELVAELTSEYLPAGSYAVDWNVGGVPPGLYFCRMESGTWSGIQPIIVGE